MMLSLFIDLILIVDLRIDYLHPAPCEDLIFEANTITEVSQKVGKLIRADMICWNSEKTRKIAIGRGLYNVYNSPSSVDLSSSLRDKLDHQ